jgi:hypothetical protein
VGWPVLLVPSLPRVERKTASLRQDFSANSPFFPVGSSAVALTQIVPTRVILPNGKEYDLFNAGYQGKRGYG